MPASLEQKHVAHLMHEGKIVIVVEAVSGSGKTSTIVLLGQEFPNLEFRILQYNRDLCKASRERFQAVGCTNLKTDTIHKFAHDICHLAATHKEEEEEEEEKEGLRTLHPQTEAKEEEKQTSVDQLLEKCEQILRRLFRKPHSSLLRVLREQFAFDALVIDEAQDLTLRMTRLIFCIWHVLARDPIQSTVHPSRMIWLGDRMQAIYTYGADPSDARFFVSASTWFAMYQQHAQEQEGKKACTWSVTSALPCTTSDARVAHVSLTTCYRLAPPIVSFLNRHVFHRPLLRPRTETPPVANGLPPPPQIPQTWEEVLTPEERRHVRLLPYSMSYASKVMVDWMNRWFRLKVYRPEDIYILVSSTRMFEANEDRLDETQDFNPWKQPPLVQLVNLLWKANIPTLVRTKGSAGKVPNDTTKAMVVVEELDPTVVMTFHKSKGCERKVVFVLGFDQRAKRKIQEAEEEEEEEEESSSLQTVCPPIWYVALTRASEQLILQFDPAYTFPFYTGVVRPASQNKSSSLHSCSLDEPCSLDVRRTSEEQEEEKIKTPHTHVEQLVQHALGLNLSIRSMCTLWWTWKNVDVKESSRIPWKRWFRSSMHVRFAPTHPQHVLVDLVSVWSRVLRKVLVEGLVSTREHRKDATEDEQFATHICEWLGQAAKTLPLRILSQWLAVRQYVLLGKGNTHLQRKQSQAQKMRVFQTETNQMLHVLYRDDSSWASRISFPPTQGILWKTRTSPTLVEQMAHLSLRREPSMWKEYAWSCQPDWMIGTDVWKVCIRWESKSQLPLPQDLYMCGMAMEGWHPQSIGYLYYPFQRLVFRIERTSSVQEAKGLYEPSSSSSSSPDPSGSPTWFLQQKITETLQLGHLPDPMFVSQMQCMMKDLFS